MSGPVDILGVLLAGGLSRRMGGGDKCLAPLGGRPMLAHAIDRLGPQVGGLVLNANGDAARFAAFGLPVAPDPVEGFAGPLAGVLAGMRWALAHAPQARHVVSAATDTPFFPRDLVSRLAVTAPDGSIVLAASQGRVHPVFGLWPVALADDLQAFLTAGETRKVLAWVDRHPNAACDFTADPDPFFNTNEPADLERAEAMLGRGAA